MNAEDRLSLPVGRLSAELAKSDEVRVVEPKSEERATIYLTNNGIGYAETLKIRSFGWRIVAIAPRFNRISVKRWSA